MATCQSQNHLVFVYGTLKKGQPNEYVMKALSANSFIADAETVKTYPLVIAGPFNLPMLLNIESTGKNVHGELHGVDDRNLKRLDEFEGHPEFYERLEVDVLKQGTTEHVRCWTYFIKDLPESHQNLPYLESYDSSGPHGLQYDTSENDELDTS